jgi:hypothetical protein
MLKAIKVSGIIIAISLLLPLLVGCKAEYSLHVSVYGGQGVVTPSSGTYTDGTTVTIAAIPDSGWEFDHWSGSISGSENPYNVQMKSDKTIGAYFVVIPTPTAIPTSTPEATPLPTPIPTATLTLTPTPTPTYRTSIGGIISSDTTWAVANSPYKITSTVQIPSGVTLTIEQGVTITMTGTGNMFLLLGTIYAHGTAQAPIIFDGGGSSTIFGTDPGHGNGDFEYCVFEHSGELWNRWGQFNLRYSQLINLTSGSDHAIGGACIKMDGSTGDCNIEYNQFINTGGIYSYWNNYGMNIRYNLFQGLVSPLCNAGGGGTLTPNQMNVNYNSFIDITGIILSLEPGFSQTIDATNNYWDTTDTSIIDQKIYDGNDDVRIGSYVTYLPILTAPDPSTPTSP